MRAALCLYILWIAIIMYTFVYGVVHFFPGWGFMTFHFVVAALYPYLIYRSGKS